MAAYRDLESLRHDFPVILTAAGDEYVQSLTAAVDAALRAVAPPGVAGEALRRRALKVEREICRRVAAGERGTVAELWDRAVQAVAPPGDAAFLKDAGKVRVQLAADGEVAGCDAALPARFLRHAWSTVQKEKARVARERIGSLVIRLGDILRADYARSEAALAQPALQASFGAAHRGMFDFGAMSRLAGAQPAARRARRATQATGRGVAGGPAGATVLPASRRGPGIRRVRVRVRECRRPRWPRFASACPSLRGC